MFAIALGAHLTVFIVVLHHKFNLKQLLFVLFLLELIAIFLCFLEIGGNPWKVYFNTLTRLNAFIFGVATELIAQRRYYRSQLRNKINKLLVLSIILFIAKLRV